MFTEYITKEVLQPVTVEVITHFNYSVSLPVAMVRDIVLRHSSKENGTVVLETKINAIKELRELCCVKDDFNRVVIGLREAKEMIEEVYRELQERSGDANKPAWLSLE